jgi:hypothetical protein
MGGMADHSGATGTVRSSDGTPIAYVSVGSGPPVIVLPGVLSMARDYAAFANAEVQEAA